MAAEDIKRVIFDKYFLFLLVIIVVHLYDGLVLQFNRGGTAFLETFAIYLLLAVFGAFFVFGPDLGFMSQEWWKNLLVCMLVSGVAWGLPFLLYLIVGNFAMGSQAIVKITGIMLFSPAWLWFMYMHQKVQESPLAGRILMWYFAMWIIVICLSFINYASVIGPVNSYKAPVWQAALMVLNWIWSTLLMLFQALMNIPQAINDGIQQSVAMATGDYYTGQVEENQDNKELGVFFSNMATSDPSYMEGDPVSVWVNLKARTLEEPVQINLVCNAADENDTLIAGTAYPETINVDQYEETTVSCDFPAGTLRPGYYDVTVNATFNFETRAYLKTYFMNKETLRVLHREQKDVFAEYPVIQANPTAIFTMGPVGIGIESNEPPIPISTEDNVRPLVGITLDNIWFGEIERLNDLFIYLPGGIDLDNSVSTCEFDSSGTEEGYNAYRLRDPGRFGNIDLYRSFKCRMDVSIDDLDDAPVTIRYIKASALYTYVVGESIGLEIEPEEEVEI